MKSSRTDYRNLIPSAAGQRSGAATDDPSPGQGVQGQAGAGFSALVDATYRNRKSVGESGAHAPEAPAETSSAADDDVDAWQQLTARTYERRHAERAEREKAAAEDGFIVATDRAEGAQTKGDPGPGTP